MKELTIEQKAQAYDKSLNRAKKLYNEEETSADVEIACEIIFPELKESDDEKIRKAILNYLKKMWGNCKDNICGIHVEDAITWLEKQGGPNPYSGASFKYNGHTWGMCARDGGVEILVDGEIKERVFLDNSQGEHNTVEFDDINAKRMFIKALERVEEQNDKGYKLTDCDKNSWWEDFKIYTNLKIYVSDAYISDAGQCIPFSCVNHADKVEPKFHEEYWITIDKPCQIINIDSKGYYIVQYCDNEKTHVLSKNFCESNFHLWTIQDAKDGDVLATDKSVFIYAKVLYNKPYAYCGIDKFGVFKDNCLENNWTNSVDNIYPATKEQRDNLIKAMAEAGYTFDFEKKELKKIEDEPKNYKQQLMSVMTDLVEDYINQKPAWSEEDEHRVKDIIYFLDTAKKHYASTVELDTCIDWLKSLKERIG